MFIKEVLETGTVILLQLEQTLDFHPRMVSQEQKHISENVLAFLWWYYGNKEGTRCLILKWGR